MAWAGIGGDNRRRFVGGRVYDVVRLERIAFNLEKSGFNCYLGLNPAVFDGCKARYSDVKALRYILIDLDPIGACTADEITEAAGIIREQIPESIEIDSGRGYQFWLRVVDCPDMGTDRRDDIQIAVGAYLRHLGTLLAGRNVSVDARCSDLSRIARCPGTINTKTGRRAVLRRLGEQSIGFSTIMAFKPKRTDAVVVKSSNPAMWLAHPNDTAVAYLFEGVDEPGRHGAAYAAAASLADLGVDKETAFKALVRGGSLCRPKLYDEASFKRSIDGAYRRKECST